MEYIPIDMKEGYSIEPVKSLAAQMTYKLLSNHQLANVKAQYDAMSDDDLKHLRNM